MNRLFYDDKCSLCIGTINFLKKYIKPSNLEYIAISDSNLGNSELKKALNEMLLITSSNQYLWGYDTYWKILTISESEIRFILKLLSKIMRIFLIRTIGIYIYKYIAKRRPRCDDNCLI
tara:strand:- start:141 stop:497 length:357 start_codon:yes stop_codon:yes gene_type:complete